MQIPDEAGAWSEQETSSKNPKQFWRFRSMTVT